MRGEAGWRGSGTSEGGWRGREKLEKEKEACAMLLCDGERTGDGEDDGKEGKVDVRNSMRQVPVDAGNRPQEGCEDWSGSEQKEAGA